MKLLWSLSTFYQLAYLVRVPLDYAGFGYVKSKLFNHP